MSKKVYHVGIDSFNVRVDKIEDLLDLAKDKKKVNSCEFENHINLNLNLIGDSQNNNTLKATEALLDYIRKAEITVEDGKAIIKTVNK